MGAGQKRFSVGLGDSYKIGDLFSNGFSLVAISSYCMQDRVAAWAGSIRNSFMMSEISKFVQTGPLNKLPA